MEASALTLGGVVIVALGGLVGYLFVRLSNLETRVKKSESYTRELWLWAKVVIDLYYRHRAIGAPDPPPIPDDD